MSGERRGVAALRMTGDASDDDDESALRRLREEGEEEEGPEDKKAAVSVPVVSWVSLAMLLLVYVSNQWTRSLVYCEFEHGAEQCFRACLSL